MIAGLAARATTVAEWLLAAAMLAMLGMVFGNVVLRYGFDSGITVTEEISRFLFVWLTFLGAVIVMQRRGHLGFDLVVRSLPRRGRQVCRIVAGVLMLICCWVFLQGAWTQTAMNLGNAAPVSGLPLGYAYAAAVVGAAGLGLLVIADLVSALRGHEPPAPEHVEDPGA